MGKGSETRERILTIAEASVLAKGFGATSIEEIIAEAGLTKSGFFYHFRDKNELARALIVRYDVENQEMFRSVFGRAEQLADNDPVPTLLIGLTLLAETMADLPKGHPGCLIASMTYQERLFDREVRALMTATVVRWNQMFRDRISAAAESCGGMAEEEIERLAQMVYCVVDGGIVLGRALDDPSILPAQILSLRGYLKMLLQPALRARRAA